MENLIPNDNICKISLNLNDNKDHQHNAVIDINFNKGDDYYSVIYDEFTLKNSPLILLDELSPLMEVFIQEQNKSKKFYTKGEEGRELLRLQSSVYKKIKELWQMKRDELLKLEERERKVINDDWKKLVLLKSFNKDEQLTQFQNKANHDIELYDKKKNEEEMQLSLKQEKEMMEVNTNDKPIDLIANEHLNQLRQFKYNSRRELAELLVNAHDDYINIINEEFALHQHAIEPNYTKPILNDNKRIDDHSLFNINLLFNHRLSFGNSIAKAIEVSVYSVPDLIENSLKGFLSIGKSNNGTINTLNDILSSSDAFGNDLYSILNFFSYDINDKSLSHLLNNSKIIFQTVSNELFFESNANTFLQIENTIIQLEKTPNDYDIITTKHTNSKAFDIMLNVYLSNFHHITDEDLAKCKKYNDFNYYLALGNIIYFTNTYCIQTLIIPLDKLMEKVYKCNQDSEFKIYMKHFKQILSIINQSYQSVIKLGVNITTKRIVFETMNSFVLAFEKCNDFETFAFSFKQFFIKG